MRIPGLNELFLTIRQIRVSEMHNSFDESKEGEASG